jgi:hypothetical protein
MMSAQMNQHSDRSSMPSEREGTRLLGTHVRIVGALLLVALGLVFLLQEAGLLSRSGNWWIIFLLIPGLDILWSGINNYRQTHSFTGAASVQLIGGVALVLLSAIFVFDPTWSFTRGWTLFSNFRLFSDINWNVIWPFALILLGVWALLGSRRRR